MKSLTVSADVTEITILKGLIFSIMCTNPHCYLNRVQLIRIIVCRARIRRCVSKSG